MRTAIKSTQVLSPRTLPELTIRCSIRSIDSLNVQQVTSPLGQVYVPIPNDIGLFIKQQQLIQYNPSSVNSVLAEFRASSTPLSDALKTVSDDEILSSVKSRYIQSPADMQSYVNRLGSVFDDTVRELAYKRSLSRQSSVKKDDKKDE